jgi:hypothetical protein
MLQFRQGDLLFDEVRKIPKEAKKSESRVLAYGEVTGHSHTLVGDYTRFDAEDGAYVRSGGCEVVHNEHEAIPLESGRSFRVSRQREYDPRTTIPRQVID